MLRVMRERRAVEEAAEREAEAKAARLQTLKVVWGLLFCPSHAVLSCPIMS